MAENTAFYDGGVDITCHASAAVAIARFVKITGDRRPGGPAGISDAANGDGLVVAAQCVAGDKAFGVSNKDAAINGRFDAMRAPKVVPVEAGAVIAAGQEVQSDANGRAIPLAAGKANGYCLSGAVNLGIAQIALYA